MNEALNIEPHVIEAVVNHQSGTAKAGVAGIYNRAQYIKQRRVALESWAKHVMGIVCISGEVFDRVGEELTSGYQSLGEQQVKNIPNAVRIYRLPKETI